jgi:ComEC/Rec2-related protein
MGFAALTGISAAGLLLVLTAVFLLCAMIPLFFKYGNILSPSFIKTLREDEEAIPVLSMIFMLLTMATFGSYRYVSELRNDYANHFKTICEKHDETTNWRIRGRIIEEPKLRGDYLEVLIQPETMRKFERRRVRVQNDTGSRKSGGTYENVEHSSDELKVGGGLLMAQVYEDNEVFREVDFNQTVEIEGQLSEASERRNPGAMDYRQHLRNRGIYRTVRITPRRAVLKIVDQQDSGAIWYRFALYVKNEVLKVIKQTMPYPESSFLGGVLLGLKGGLPPKVSQEFRMTGVSHVLAVSGLHVTIIAGLLYGVFAMFRIPLRVFAPLIVFSLFTFAMIVGWPSSAVRAALMNSLFILSMAYLKDYGFKMSVLFSLCVACDYILFMSPLQLTEPSFVLSVMAIYALAMFSDPSAKILRRMLRGPGLAFAFFATLAFFAAVIIKKDLVLHPYFFPATFFYIIAVCYISTRLSDRSTFQSFAFEMLPGWLQGFLAAQIAIFVAMMGPLSAFYFGQLSLAAPIANLIAIPLIGLIVQIGLIAGLFGAFIPGIGIFVALVLNAANWLAVKFFLGMASFFAVLIPFPRISQPAFSEIVIYYLLLHGVYFRHEIKTWLLAIYGAVSEVWHEPEYRNSLSLFAIFVVIIAVAGSVAVLSNVERQPDLRLTMLDVGYGSSLMIEGDGRVAIIDAALNDTMGGIDRGERVIQPALSGKQVREIDAVILSSALPERISGLSSVCSTYRVNRLYVPFPLATDGVRVDFERYVRMFAFGDIKMERRLKAGQNAGFPPGNFWELSYESYNQLIEDVHHYKIPVTHVKAGDKFTEAGTTIEVLHPVKTKDSFQQYYDGLILKISRGPHNFAYLSGNTHPLESDINFKADFVFVADMPYPYDAFEKYVKSSNPEGVAISFRFPSAWLMENYHLSGAITSRSRSYIPRFRQLTFPVYLTSENGAVQVDQLRGTLKTRVFVKE